MSTETTTATAKAGNISVADLGARLLATSKKSSAAQTTTSEHSPSEREPTEEQTEETSQQTNETETGTETQTEEQTSETTAGTETETEQTEQTEQTDETQETTDQTEETTEQTELHPELQAAIDEAKKGGNKGTAKLLKRLHGLVDQRDTERMGRLNAERERDVIKQQLEEAQKNPQAEAAPNRDRYSSVPEVATIDKQLSSAEAFLDWCEENPDGGIIGKQELSAEQVRKMKRTAESDRIRLNSERSSLVAELRQTDKQAEQKFTSYAYQIIPELKDKTSEVYQQRETILKTVPGIKDLPGRELIIARYILGCAKENELIDAAKANGKKVGAPMKRPTGGNNPPAVTARPGAAAPKVNAKQAEAQAADQQFKKTGKVDDLAKRFATKNLARREAARV